MADPTRRVIVECLTTQPRTTGELVEHFSPALVRTAVMKHLDVLEEAGLIHIERVGRVRWNHLNPIPIQLIYDRWVVRHVRPVAALAVGLERHVASRTSRSISPERRTKKRKDRR